jgi:hypothetical protein
MHNVSGLAQVVHNQGPAAAGGKSGNAASVGFEIKLPQKMPRTEELLKIIQERKYSITAAEGRKVEATVAARTTIALDVDMDTQERYQTPQDQSDAQCSGSSRRYYGRHEHTAHGRVSQEPR